MSTCDRQDIINEREWYFKSFKHDEPGTMSLQDSNNLIILTVEYYYIARATLNTKYFSSHDR